MKKVLSMLCLICLIGAFTYAQEAGNLKGTVSDEDGTPLPGVTVTLSSTKILAQTVITSERGNFRFMGLPVARDYALRLELPGFNTLIREKLDISFGRDLSLSLTLSQATLEEEITVIGESPVIDTKRTQVGVNITSEMIMSLPTSRNPWVIMSLVPGMLIDREDVGGNEAGQQSSYYGHGGLEGDTTWSIDGASITDMSALGAAPAYVNIASYEELQINYGNNDVRSQTGGVQLNIISKRGGNSYSGTFYMDVEKSTWQAENLTSELEDIGYTSAGINRVYLYGVNFGGPLLKDRLWFYGSWAVQDIDARTLAGGSDKTWLTSGYAKLNAQLTPTTRVEAFLEYDNKNKWGRSAWGYTVQGPETLWNQKGPGYIWKGEVEQTMGNLYLNLKGIFMDGGFNLEPVQGKHTADGSGNYMVREYYPTFFVSGNIDDYGADRDSFNLNLTGNYFAEGILGGDHEIKFGVDYLTAKTTTFDYYEGNLVTVYYGPNANMPNGEDWVVWAVSDYEINVWMRKFGVYVQDTMTFGKLAVNFGIRYDREESKVKDAAIPASPWLPSYMPALSVDEIDPGVTWSRISPRMSLIYDVTGDGKNVIKVSAARYGSQGGFGLAYFVNPLGWREIDLYWQDANTDGRVTAGELWGYDWATDTLMDPNDSDYWLWSGGVNIADPTSTVPTDQIDPNYNSPLLDELTISYERELMPDFAARLEFFYKKQHSRTWTKGMFADGTVDSASNYYAAGTGAESGATYYGRTSRPPYRYRTNYDQRYDQYLAGQIVLKKRLSNRWMLDASFTYSDWKQVHKGEYLAIDSSSVAGGLNNGAYYDGGKVAPESGGSGVRGIFVNSRWMFKFSGLYQMPIGFNIAGVFRAREGYIIRADELVSLPGIGARSIYGPGSFGDLRLPAFWELDLRLEKVWNVTETSTVIFAVDAFNITNSAHVLKEETRLTAD
ncbi:MAG TPA: TonB-dependent receptor, partial [Candidatus Aminicenantes bacterium]|nr:TonB-dependent receptor [Candidatus Aminicenantes bacterium]